MTNEHDDNALLTDEERAAMAADEGEEIDGSASLTGEDTQQYIDDGWGKSSIHERPEEPEAEEKDGEAAAPPEPEAAPEPEPEPAREPAPVDTSAHDQQIKELREQESALFDKYDDGDLSRQEFEEQKAELSSKVDEAIEARAIDKQRIADDTQRWTSAVSSYLGEYEGLRDEKIISAFDSEVRAVTANPAFASKSFKEQLAIAHKRLETTAEDMGLEGVPPLKGRAPKAEKQEQPAKQKKAEPGGDELHTPPKTLAKMPASEISDSGDSKYAGLQRLMDDDSVHPDDKEAALAKLSDKERNDFASMGI